MTPRSRLQKMPLSRETSPNVPSRPKTSRSERWVVAGRLGRGVGPLLACSASASSPCNCGTRAAPLLFTAAVRGSQLGVRELGRLGTSGDVSTLCVQCGPAFEAFRDEGLRDVSGLRGRSRKRSGAAEPEGCSDLAGGGRLLDHARCHARERHQAWTPGRGARISRVNRVESVDACRAWLAEHGRELGLSARNIPRAPAATFSTARPSPPL